MSADRPLTTYFIGLLPGSVRDYLPKDGATCCEGTGLESATKYQDSVYFHGADDLYVNLYCASSVQWGGVRVTQTTNFPYEQGTTLTIDGAGSFTLRVRVPPWTSMRVEVNGQPHEAGPDGYVAISCDWTSGDVVRIDLPFSLRTEPTPDDPTLASVFYGPIHLVALDNRRDYVSVDLDTFRPIPDNPLHFDANGTEFAPFFEGTTEAFHSYVRVS